MKVTKRQLKNIIKEEIEATMQEQGGDKMAQAEQLAQALSQSPAVMDFVNKAKQDPEVKAALQDAQGTMQEYKSAEQKHSDMVGASLPAAAGAMGIASATGGMIAMGKIGMVGAGAVGAATTLGIPAAAGLMAAALGILIYQSFNN